MAMRRAIARTQERRDPVDYYPVVNPKRIDSHDYKRGNPHHYEHYQLNELVSSGDEYENGLYYGYYLDNMDSEELSEFYSQLNSSMSEDFDNG